MNEKRRTDEENFQKKLKKADPEKKMKKKMWAFVIKKYGIGSMMNQCLSSSRTEGRRGLRLGVFKWFGRVKKKKLKSKEKEKGRKCITLKS